MYRREKEHKKLQTRIRQEQKMKQAGRAGWANLIYFKVPARPAASKNLQRDKNFYQFSGFDVSSLDDSAHRANLQYQTAGQLYQSRLEKILKYSRSTQTKYIFTASKPRSFLSNRVNVHPFKTNKPAVLFPRSVKYPSCIYSRTCILYIICILFQIISFNRKVYDHCLRIFFCVLFYCFANIYFHFTKNFLLLFFETKKIYILNFLSQSFSQLST